MVPTAKYDSLSNQGPKKTSRTCDAFCFFFSSRRRHTRSDRDWSSDVCSSDLFALTVQDLEEGRVKWDLGRPYMIRHDADGYCHHVERETKRCGIYENRPVVCREIGRAHV